MIGQNLLNFAVSKIRKQLIKQVSCLLRDLKNGNSCFYVEIQDTYASFVGFKYSYKNILNTFFSFFAVFCCVRLTILNLTANILDYIKKKKKKTNMWSFYA